MGVGMGPRWLVLVCVLAGCFRDAGPGQLCEGTGCGGSTGSATAAPTSTTAPGSATEVSAATTGSGAASETTGVAADNEITMRLDSMRFIDPHLFLADTSDPNTPKCTADITVAVNDVLSGNIDAGDFNLLLRFEDFPALQEVRMIEAECEPGKSADAPWVCTPNDSLAVVLGLEVVAEQACRALDLSVYQAANTGMINDPQQPCMRTKKAAFSLPIGGSIGVLELRDTQFVASLDDSESPTKLMNGALYGFLPRESAQDLTFEIPLFGKVTLWSVIDVPACEAAHPTQLPSVDIIEVNNMDAPGVWLAINFTAERVVYLPAP